MKKIYIAPAVEINETVISNMMALSLPVTEGNPTDTPDVKAEEEFYGSTIWEWE